MTTTENSPIASYTCNLQGQITYFNDAAAQIWGRKPTIGKDLWWGARKIFYPDGTPMPKEEHPAVKAIRTGKFNQKSEVRIECPDHSIKVILFIPQPQYNKDGKLVGGHFSLIDITEYVADHIRQATLSAIVESSDDAIISKDLNGKITSWNSGAQRIFGYSEDEVLGKSITILFPESRIQEEEKIISRLKKGERIDHFETLRVDKSGRLIPLSLTISPVKDIHGKVVGASKVARDISERLKSYEKQAILSAIVESSDDAIVSKDLNGIIISWNRGAQEIFGYSEEEAVGNSITMLIPKDKLQEETLILSKIRKGEKIDHFETIRRHKSGRKIAVSITVSPVKDHKGTIIGASKVARDITLQVQSQEALKRYSDNLEILNSAGKFISENLNVKQILQRVTNITTELTQSHLGVFFYDVANFEDNPNSFFTISGAPGEIIKKLRILKFNELIPESFQKMQVFHIDDIENFNNDNRIYQQLQKSLDLKSFMAVPVVSKSGVVIGGLLFGHRDVNHFDSEHELLVANIAGQAATSLQNSNLFEQVKSLSEKKDEFIALASHELKTPLTTIKGYIQLLCKINSDEKASSFLQKTLNQVDRLNTLIEDLLNMSRIENGKLEFRIEAFDLSEMLVEIVSTFNHSSQSHYIEYEAEETPFLIEGDAQRIEQVIINILSNAIKYSPHANKVEVKIEDNDNTVMIKIRDYGLGMSKQQQKNLFQRFYRAENSKGINGLGIGLYLSKQIVDRHKGKIEVSSECGKGSKFSITLPKTINTPERITSRAV